MTYAQVVLCCGAVFNSSVKPTEAAGVSEQVTLNRDLAAEIAASLGGKCAQTHFLNHVSQGCQLHFEPSQKKDQLVPGFISWCLVRALDFKPRLTGLTSCSANPAKDS